MGPWGRKKWQVEFPTSIEGFKYSQDLASKLWVAMALIVYYSAGLK
jgi:hypothetical protein